MARRITLNDQLAAAGEGTDLTRVKRADGRTAYVLDDQVLTPGEAADQLIPGGRDTARDMRNSHNAAR